MVSKTTEEWDAMSPEARKAHLAAEEMTVFGRTVTGEPAYKKIKGVPQEMGIGSPGNETANHFLGIRKSEGEEAYQAALAETWKRDPDRARKLNLPKPQKAA